MNVATILDMLYADPSIIADQAGFIARMNAKTERHENHALVNAQQLLSKFGLAEVGRWSAALSDYPLILQVMAAGGLDFADPQLQAVANAMEQSGKLSHEDAQLFREMGVWYTSPADRNGGTCTQADVNAAIVLYNRKPLLDDAERRYQTVVNAINSGEVTDVAGMKAKFSE